MSSKNGALEIYSTPGDAVAALMRCSGDESAYKCSRCDYYHVEVLHGGAGSKLGHMSRRGGVIARPW